MSMTPADTQSRQDFLRLIEDAFERSNTEFARAYYLFATARLSETYNSGEIYARYPQLTDEKTFHEIKALYDQNPDDEQITRLFTSVLDFYIGNRLSAESDEILNLKNTLKVDTRGLDIRKEDGMEIAELLYEDVSEWLKKIESKPVRQELYDRMAKAYTDNLAPKVIGMFHAKNTLLAELGYPDIIGFYSRTSGHDLPRLGDQGKALVEGTDHLYGPRIAEWYKKRTGADFSEATRADISYVFHGKSPEMAAIDGNFPESNLVPLAMRTFDGLGLDFSRVARIVDFKSREEYDREVVERGPNVDGFPEGAVLLDIAKREGKRSRAFVYPSLVAREIYLSVKPEGGLDDYSAFFHESGHALHFAYESPGLGYAMALMGNNTVTETYAYTFQNLFLNRHWLRHMAGLSAEEALNVVRRGALNDLYMLRRYSSKMRFELALYEGDASKGISLEGKDKVYADLLTRGTGFRYDAEGWSRDVDAGFYVADYFTAWTLEAMLREYLCKHFGSSDVQGEDWYANPKAGEFLRTLWKEGNLSQKDLASRLGSNDPNDIDPLLRLMAYNLGD